MHILQIHNFYRQAGGEDNVVASEEKLLTRRGHQMWQYSLHNDIIPAMPKLQVALKTLWNEDAYRAVRHKIQKNGIDLIHAHNTFPLISPAVYYAAQKENVPVVQTLHNYRLLCPAATFFRDGEPCEDCMGKQFPYPAAWHHCYRDSRAASAMTALMLGWHRTMKTYVEKVSAYIAPSKFALEKFVEGGLPRARMHLKSNFVLEDPGIGIGSGYGGYALFVGRLAPEKGVATLLKAWAMLKRPVPLKIAGDGDLRIAVEAAAKRTPNIEYLGQCARARVNELMRNAALLVFPSEWYEVSPLTVMEAMACGTPVLASDAGSLPEMIRTDENGLVFPAADAEALAEAVEEAWESADYLSEIRYSTRQYYERHFAAAANYEVLMEIYQQVLVGGRSDEADKTFR
jgi:glycosyltransferase involved in cell wall biosynthesis